MVSLDTVEKNQRFSDSLDGNFPLLSDSAKKTARAYGVLGLGGLFAKRWTFYIDPQGIVRHIDRKVKPAKHGGVIAGQLQALGFPRKR